MNPGRIRFALATTTLLPALAYAAGLGELTLHSRIGERLYAEIPVNLNGHETADGSCFSLAPIPGADLPVVTRARVRLVHGHTGSRLLIEGQQPINEPLLTLNLRAQCGLDLQRTYTLAPELAAPIRSQATAVDTPPRTSNSTSAWRASQGETLSDIADTLAEGNPDRRHQLLAALLKANPGFKAETALPEGQNIGIPSLRQSDHAPRPAPQRKQESATSTPRLQIGAAPSEVTAEQRPAQQQAMAEMETRMLRMENSLRSLHDEVTLLQSAVELGAKAQVARHELQLALQLESPPAPALPEQAGSALARNQWLQLLLSAIGSGIVSALLVALLTRRNARAKR